MGQRDRQVFRDSQLEEQFWRDGFLTLPLLNETDLAYCRELFKRMDPKIDTQFYSSIDSPDVPYRYEVDRKLRELLDDKVAAILLDYTAIAYTFIVKRPGKQSAILSHVDDTHVDQNKYASVNIWCPLVDTNEINGALEVLRGSHRLPYPPRGLGLPFPYSSYEPMFRDKMEMVYQKAGVAILYHDMLIHRSPPNMSDSIRPAVITGTIPQEATPIIYFQYPGLAKDKVEKFAVNRDFWISFDKRERPERGVKSLGFEDYYAITISDEEFWEYIRLPEHKIKQAQQEPVKITPSKGLLARIKRFFGQ